MRKSEDKALSKRLEGVLDGPEGFLFKGESQELSDRAVIDLSELHQALKISDETYRHAPYSVPAGVRSDMEEDRGTPEG